MRGPAAATLMLAAAALLAACAQAPQPPPDPGVANNELGIRLVSVPEGLELSRNEGAVLELKPADETVHGSILFAVGPEERGVNLVAAVKEHQARIESLPGGEYLGAQELQGPLGTAFYSRGRYRQGDQVEEETVILSLHPSENRYLEISYRYPADDDSAARVEQLIGVLAAVENTETEGS